MTYIIIYHGRESFSNYFGSRISSDPFPINNYEYIIDKSVCDHEIRWITKIDKDTGHNVYSYYTTIQVGE